jgi:hypothetical protein
MTANDARYSLKDWAIGIAAFMLFGAVMIPLVFVALKATAPYGWNHILLPVGTIALASLSWTLRRRATR